MNLQLVKEELGTAESQHDRRIVRRLSVVESEVKRLQSILDQFLEYVRVPELRTRPTLLNEMLQDLVEFVSPEAEEKDVSLRFYGDADLEQIELDPDQFRAVVVNLLRNALDACGAGDQIMLSTRAEDGEVTVQVTDTGSGMSAEVLEKAFTPYFSTKKTGTGLGLPTARRIIEMHGGTLELNSDPERGTQFTIRLPRAPASREKDAT